MCYDHLQPGFYLLKLNGYLTTNVKIIYRMFNKKVDRELSREYFTSDVIYNVSAGMILYYYMCSRGEACGRSPAEIVGSNPTGGMDICLL